MREERGGAEGAEIGVEVLVHRHEVADFDAGGLAAFVQSRCRMTSGRIVVARDIEPAPGGSEGRAARWLAERAAISGSDGSTEASASIVSTPSPAATTPPARGQALPHAEADAVAEETAEGAARIGDRRLRRAGAVEPAALDAGDGAGSDR